MRTVDSCEFFLIAGGTGPGPAPLTKWPENEFDRQVREMCDNQGWGDRVLVSRTESVAASVGVSIPVGEDTTAGFNVGGGGGTTESLTCGQARSGGKP